MRFLKNENEQIGNQDTSLPGSKASENTMRLAKIILRIAEVNKKS